MTIFTLVAYLLGALVITTTLLPIWRTTRWWVRVCDFPRFQIAVLGIVILTVFPIAKWPLAVLDTVLLISVALSVLWQLLDMAILPRGAARSPNRHGAA